jgi:hypothetical protein
MYCDHLSEFMGKKVVDFESSKSWKGPGQCYRVRQDYEDETTTIERFEELLEQPGANELETLVIGAWGSVGEGDGPDETVEALCKAAPVLPKLRGLFFGDITSEEAELSWINQSDLSPILSAFPGLEVLAVRGGQELSFSKVRHERLRKLTIETGGLSRSVLRELAHCEFPALEHLELHLGEPNYGFDGGVEDLQPLLDGKRFPKLQYLGLRNAEVSNDVAAFVVNTPIVRQIETLDLSLGNIDGEGENSLSALRGLPNLKTLDISHHYATEDEIKKLRGQLSCKVIAEDRQEAEDDGEWRPILHAE